MAKEQANISELKFDDKNFNAHTQKGMGLLEKSLQKFGAGRSILIDKDNNIIAGNGIVEAAGAVGLDKVRVIETDGTEIVAVKRTDVTLDSAQGREMALADNATAAQIDLSWDNDLISEQAEQWGFDPSDWADIGNKYNERYNDFESGSLSTKFLVPPFSVLDTRKEEWQERKRKWNTLITDGGETRASFGGGAVQQINNGVSILDAALVEVMYKWFMPDNIDYKPAAFDCFAGDSVGGFVMSYLGADFSGIELREEQAKLNNERVDAHNLTAKYYCDDGRNVAKYLKPESQDLFFSCPPYFDLEHYSDDARDASNQGSYQEFIDLLDTAFANSIKCLKKNRFAIVVMSAVRDKKGYYYDIPSDITRIFQKHGCHLYNQLILVEAVGTLAFRAGNNMKNRKVGRCHQEVLVYYKPDKDRTIQQDFNNIKEDYENED